MKHTFRGAVTAWMALIVLQTIGTSGGSGKVASLFTDVNKLVQRALSPNVAAIPDRRSPKASAGDTPSPYLNGVTPNDLTRGAGNAGILTTPGFQQGLDNGALGNYSPADLTRLGDQLKGVGQYTPEQLMQLWGIPNN